MTFTRFIGEVDKFASGMTKKQLCLFLHEYARICREEGRERFLEMLKEAGGKSVSVRREDENENVHEDLEQQFARIAEKLKDIEEGKTRFLGFLNEEYDDWYSEEDDEFLFEDPDHITDTIDEAINMVHDFLDIEEYAKAAELGAMLSGLEAQVGGEYLDYTDDGLSLRNIKDMHMLQSDLHRFAIENLVATYHAKEMNKRSEAMFGAFSETEGERVSLEEVLQYGDNELDDWEAFLDNWVDYLGQQSGGLSERLLKEAIKLWDDPGKTLGAARKHYGAHPEIYEQLLLAYEENKEDGLLLDVGKEALGNIGIQYVVRSRIALLAAKAEERAKNQKERERMLVEAFRSDTNPTMYLLLISECHSYLAYKDEVRLIYNGFSDKKQRSIYHSFVQSGLAENHIDDMQYYTLLFFNGEFEKVVDEAMNVREALGWSSTYMKCGIALFLLALHEGEKFSSGCSKMLSLASGLIGFDTKPFQMSKNENVSGDNETLFKNVFMKWKESQVISDDFALKVLGKIDKWMAKRVAGIMQNNRRNYYGECAAFLAALGEVQESRGVQNGKQKMLERYSMEYSRRSAFRSELKAYGLSQRSH